MVSPISPVSGSRNQTPTVLTFREGSRTVAGFMGTTQNVTLMNGQLYLNALPLIPQSETKFEATGAAAEFLVDANGTATRLVLSQTEGDAIYDLKR